MDYSSRHDNGDDDSPKDTRCHLPLSKILRIEMREKIRLGGILTKITDNIKTMRIELKKKKQG